MPKGIGHEYYTLLNKLIEANPAKGIYIRDLKLITEYHIQKNNLQIPISASMFTPLTEMFLMAKTIEHTFNKNREGIFVSGITFKKYETKELVETLTLGLGRSNKAVEEADRLYYASLKEASTTQE